MKFWRPKSLFVRFFLSFFFTLIVTMLCIILVMPQQLEQLLITTAERDIMEKAQIILPNAKGYLNGSIYYQSMVQLVETLEYLLNARIYIADRNGTIRVTNRQIRLETLQIAADDLAYLKDSANSEPIKRRETAVNDETGKSIQMLVIAVPVRQTVQIISGSGQHTEELFLGSVFLRVPMTSLTGTALIARRQVGYVPIIATCFALLMAGYISHSLSRPLKDLSTAALHMASGDYSTRIEYDSDDEIGRLGDSFNFLAGSLEDSIYTLQDQKNRIENLINALTEGVIAVDAEQHVILFNPAAADFLHLGITEVMDRAVQDLPLPDELALLLTTNASEPQSELIEIHDRRILSVTTSPVLDEDRDLTAQIAVLKDITESHRLEQQRKEFVANVSHELRTPLTSIQGFVEGMLDQTIPAEHSERYLNIIHQESVRLTKMIRELLDLSHIESGSLLLHTEAVELAPLLNSIVLQSRTAMHREDIHFDIDLSPPEPILLADSDRLEQILINLLTNAMKFTPQGGSIAIHSFLRSDSPAKLQIEITDSGKGIVEDDLPFIWDRFFKADRSRSSQGTGLGLSIVRSLIEAHQESVWAENRPPMGACFCFTMPYLPEDEPTQPIILE